MKKTTLIIIVLITGLFNIVSCKKKDDPAPSTTNTGGSGSTGITINSTPQVSFTMDGVAKSYVSNGTSINSGSTRGGSSSAPNNYYDYSSDLNDGNNEVYISITKGTLNFSGSSYPTDPVFTAFFSTGNISYSINAANGIMISMTDASSVFWSTSLGTADQTGSAFSIDQTQNDGSGSGYLYLKVKISFSCKLYDGNGNVKVITNGIYVGDFGNI